MSALRPSARGSRTRAHSSAKRSVSRCRPIRPSMGPVRLPSAGRARAQRRARTPATISSMEAPSSTAAATASWIAPRSGSSGEHSLSHCCMARSCRPRRAPYTAPWSVAYESGTSDYPTICPDSFRASLSASPARGWAVAWMAGTSPAMTQWGCRASAQERLEQDARVSDGGYVSRVNERFKYLALTSCGRSALA